MQPYVIKQGDYLAALAHRFGFDADTVWNDDKNARLRQTRPDPNILWPSDVLYIPDQVDAEPPTHRLETGATNTFVSDAPTVTMSIRFLDEAQASKAYSVQELPQLAGLTTAGDGTATFAIPVTLASFTVVFPDSGATFTFNTGHLDPIDTLSGVFQRLRNLGYIAVDAEGDASDIDVVRAALIAFNAAQAGGGATPPPDSSGAGAPDVWLTDDGRLEDATSKRLLGAHGM